MSQIATYTKGQGVFVPVERGAMLCIGSEQDVKESTPEDIVEMIYEARQTSAYMEIGSGKGRILH